MGVVIDFLLSTLSGVAGNSIYNRLTRDTIEAKITLAYNEAEEVFNKEYGKKYGDYTRSFLSRQENVNYIINSLGFQGNEELNYTGFNANSFSDNIEEASKEDINRFIQILRNEIFNDYDLGRLLQEKEHVIEQRNMHETLLDMNNKLKENNKLINRLLPSSNTDIKINFKEIIEIYNEKNNNEQEFKLITWLNNNNGHKEGVVLKAYIAYKQENWDLAYKLYKYIVDKYIEEFELNNTIGLICVNMGKYKEAEKYYNMVLTKIPNHLDALFNLGNLYARKYNDYKKGLAYLLKAENVVPDDSEVLNNIGVIYKENKDYENAEKYFKLGMKYSKDNPLPFLNMGDLNMDVYSNYNNAVMYFEKYLEFEHGEKDEIHNSLGLIYGSIVFKNKEKSVKHFKEALKINPFLNEARLNLNIIESERGYFDCFNTLNGQRFIDLFEQGYK